MLVSDVLQVDEVIVGGYGRTGVEGVGGLPNHCLKQGIREVGGSRQRLVSNRILIYREIEREGNAFDRAA